MRILDATLNGFGIHRFPDAVFTASNDQTWHRYVPQVIAVISPVGHAALRRRGAARTSALPFCAREKPRPAFPRAYAATRDFAKSNRLREPFPDQERAWPAVPAISFPSCRRLRHDRQRARAPEPATGIDAQTQTRRNIPSTIHR